MATLALLGTFVSKAATRSCCLRGVALACSLMAANAAPKEEEVVAKKSQPILQCSHCCTNFPELSWGLSKKTLMCQACIRTEAEQSLGVFTSDEQVALDKLAEVLDEKPLSYFKPGVQPARLSDWLFLGDLDEAIDLQLLQDRGITGVVNLVGWFQLASAIGVESSDDPVAMLASFYEGNDIAFCHREAKDDMTYDIIMNDWSAVKQTLQQWKQEGRKVLVNCKAGHNRSACMVVACLIACEGMSLVSAASHVSTLRGSILSNHSFRLQLVRFVLREGLPMGSGECDAEASNVVSQIKVDDASMGA